jgi:flagellar M-ring protein FliF
VAAGLNPKDTGAMTAALDGAGVAYELRGNGTAVAVDSKQVAQARIALAQSGVTSGQQPGYELLDKQKLGASNFQQQIAYQRALEGQIANNISQIQGVQSAQVSLTMPKDQLFAEDSQPATAAVLLGGAGALDPAAVKGIANLVASSVEGLKPDKVTITDGAGALLWPTGDAAGATGSKLAAEQRYNQLKGAQLTTMLSQTVGAGKAQVQVTADLNVDKATQEKLQYAKKGVPLKEVTETETLESTGGAGSAAAGTATNIPSYATSGGGSGGESNYEKTTRSQDLGVDKTVTRTEIAPGTVNRLNVSVLVDQAAKPDTAAIQKAVEAAVGFDAARGDVVTVQAVPFAKQETPPVAAGPIPASLSGILKPVGLGLAALLFLFFVTRGLRRRQTDAFAEEPSWLRELQAGSFTPARSRIGASYEEETVEPLDQFDPQAEARKVFASDPRAIALDDLINREPEKVAHQLRTWITEEKE